ncbi:urease accessory protein UreD [Actinoplanes sp. TFC3]|uniref:urease accessory protein UreD n=1 Tax=Actinoplanes sp. TFC3 TaxID=1710355 RepID=UPI000AFA3C90|nr:urease accessory protein UreD [Actinoplanes sp. TFC3]
MHLVGGAAGPLRGDDLRLDIEVGPGARLSMFSVAAQLALPGRPGLPASRFEIHATVATGGTLVFHPEPLIAASGCDHRASTTVTVEDGGTLLWREDLVCGRHAEPSGAAHTELTIHYAGSTLFRHDLTVGPAAPAWSGAAILGEGRAIGTLILAGPDLPEPRILGDNAALMPLTGPGRLASAVGADIRQVRAALDPLSVLSSPALLAP